MTRNLQLVQGTVFDKSDIANSMGMLVQEKIYSQTVTMLLLKIRIREKKLLIQYLQRIKTDLSKTNHNISIG